MKFSLTIRVVMLPVILSALIAVGCGKAKKSTESSELAARQQQVNDLKQIGLMYHNYLSANNDKPPTSADDFTKKPTGHQMVDADLARVVQKLKSGQYVLVYGLTMKDMLKSRSSIVAYEKDAPTTGGVVMMGDLSVRYMTPAEFQSTPEASGK